MFFAALFACVLLFMLARGIRDKRRLKKVKQFAPNEQAQIYFKAILGVLEHTIEPMAPGTTPKVFGAKLGKKFSFRSDTVFFSDLAQIYYKAKYSCHEISEKELKITEDAYYETIAYLRSEEARPVYMYLRLVKRLGTV